MAPSAPDFDWRPFDEAIEDRFRDVLQATYVGSLDMPELEATRGLEDILTGHRAAGLFRPDRWRLGRLPGEPEAAAVLLLTEVPGRDAWEVIYLGLTPAARGRGLGRAVIRHALELTRAGADPRAGRRPPEHARRPALPIHRLHRPRSPRRPPGDPPLTAAAPRRIVEPSACFWKRGRWRRISPCSR